MFLCQRTEEEPGDYVILSGCGGQRRRPPPPEPEGCLPQRSRRRTSVQTPRVRRRPVPLDLDSSVCQLSLGESRHRPQPVGLALLPSDWWPVVPQPSPLLVRIALSSTVQYLSLLITNTFIHQQTKHYVNRNELYVFYHKCRSPTAESLEATLITLLRVRICFTES